MRLTVTGFVLVVTPSALLPVSGLLVRNKVNPLYVN